MKKVTPLVYIISEPSILSAELRSYLADINASEYETDAGSDAERLIEAAGRMCYRSWLPGLNANITKVREGNVDYIQNILKSGHGSVLEHAQVTFIFSGVSRVFTHELVRHRVGVGISQESLRYVRLTELGLWFPTCIEDDPEFRHQCVSMVEALETFQKDAADRFGLDDEATSFARKKEVTSALRRIAPIGLATSIMWSCNFRTLRHVIETRTSRHAEEEIRNVFCDVAVIAKTKYPQYSVTIRATSMANG